MISIEFAKKIGITYCADAMGREFVERYANSSSTGFSEESDRVFCFLGINNREEVIDETKNLVLTSDGDAFPYRASCTVSLVDGKVQDFKFVHP